MSKTLIVVAGPTAVGKTALGVALAKHLNTEVISADSRQLYREMAIGTAKPTTEEMDGVRHHLVDSHSIHDTFTTGDFERESLQILERIFTKNNYAIVVGGTGMFINALCNGIDDIPSADEALRQQLNDRLGKEGLEVLVQQLKQLDPLYYEQVDRKNPQRVIRALEVSLQTGQPYSSFRTAPKVERPFNIIKIGLESEREALYSRIDQRMDKMLQGGLLQEAQALYPYKNLNALQTVGYSEIYGYLDGAYDWEEAVRLLKRNSRRYAKRQLTWFKRDQEIKWFEPGQMEAIIADIVRSTT